MEENNESKGWKTLRKTGSTHITAIEREVNTAAGPSTLEALEEGSAAAQQKGSAALPPIGQETPRKQDTPTFFQPSSAGRKTKKSGNIVNTPSQKDATDVGSFHFSAKFSDDVETPYKECTFGLDDLHMVLIKPIDEPSDNDEKKWAKKLKGDGDFRYTIYLDQYSFITQTPKPDDKKRDSVSIKKLTLTCSEGRIKSGVANVKVEMHIRCKSGDTPAANVERITSLKSKLEQKIQAIRSEYVDDTCIPAPVDIFRVVIRAGLSGAIEIYEVADNEYVFKELLYIQHSPQVPASPKVISSPSKLRQSRSLEHDSGSSLQLSMLDFREIVQGNRVLRELMYTKDRAAMLLRVSKKGLPRLSDGDELSSEDVEKINERLEGEDRFPPDWFEKNESFELDFNEQLARIKADVLQSDDAKKEKSMDIITKISAAVGGSRKSSTLNKSTRNSASAFGASPRSPTKPGEASGVKKSSPNDDVVKPSSMIVGGTYRYKKNSSMTRFCYVPSQVLTDRKFSIGSVFEALELPVPDITFSLNLVKEPTYWNMRVPSDKLEATARKREKGDAAALNGIIDDTPHYKEVVKENIKRFLFATAKACHHAKAYINIRAEYDEDMGNDVLAEMVSTHSSVPLMMLAGIDSFHNDIFTKLMGALNKAQESLISMKENSGKKAKVRELRARMKISGFVEFEEYDVERRKYEQMQRDALHEDVDFVDDDNVSVVSDGDDDVSNFSIPNEYGTHLIISDNMPLLQAKLDADIKNGVFIINGYMNALEEVKRCILLNKPVFIFKYTGGTADFTCEMLNKLREVVGDKREGKKVTDIVPFEVPIDLKEPEEPSVARPSNAKVIPDEEVLFLSDAEIREYSKQKTELLTWMQLNTAYVEDMKAYEKEVHKSMAIIDDMRLRLGFIDEFSSHDVTILRNLNVMYENLRDRVVVPSSAIEIDMFRINEERLQDLLTKTMSSAYEDTNELGAAQTEYSRLMYAWKLRHKLDYNASNQKTISDLLSAVTIILTLAATICAVTYAYFGNGVNVEIGVSLFQSTSATSILTILNLVLPLGVTLVKGLNASLNPQAKYGVLKLAAYSIESEIFLYRTKAGRYNPRRKSTGDGAGNQGKGKKGGKRGRKKDEDASDSDDDVNDNAKEEVSSPHKAFSAVLEDIWSEMSSSDITKGALIEPVIPYDHKKYVNERRVSNQSRQRNYKNVIKTTTASMDIRQIITEVIYISYRQSIPPCIERVHAILSNALYRINTLLAYFGCIAVFSKSGSIMPQDEARERAEALEMEMEKGVGRAEAAAPKSMRQIYNSLVDKVKSQMDQDETTDDGISPLSADEYLEIRVIPHVVHMERQAPWLSLQSSTNTTITIFFSVMSSLLTTFNYSIFIPIALATSGALTAWNSYAQTDLNLHNINSSVHQMNQMIVWWQSLSVFERRVSDNKERLVITMETIYQNQLVGFSKKTGSGDSGSSGGSKDKKEEEEDD